MFAMALVMWGFDVTNFVREVQTTLIRDPDLPMSAKYASAVQMTFSLVAPLDLLYAYMSILGDGIVVWRVYALWRHTKQAWVVLMPLALLFGSLVIGNIPGVESNPRLSFAFFVYSFSTSVVVGIYPTVVIILAHSDHAVLDTAVASIVVPSTLTSSTYPNFKTGLRSAGSAGRTNDLDISVFSMTTRSRHSGEEKPVLTS
ncbi:hypothetical protein DXG01_005200 [Tephrocybe rancida]|nr:hypothetical protein DXG01_005200 [Tephrocybe rancida]